MIVNFANRCLTPMGVPNAPQARTTIQEEVSNAPETPDLFITNPELYSVEIGNLSDRAATSLSSQTLLSDEGQQAIQNEIDQSSEAVQSILNTSDEAQGYDSTQDVVKALARINAGQSVMAVMSQVASLRNRTDTQFTNLNLANISRSIDQQNRDHQANSTVDGFFLLNLTAQSNLF